MTAQREEWKVGAFVLLCLGLLAVLMIYFSRGLTLFSNHYSIHLVTGNVGGIKTKASVLMAGIPVGNVIEAELGQGGTNVSLTLRINKKYSIRSSALFVIEQSGFLGDQYVAIYPQKGDAPFLVEGDVVSCAEPFNLQEVARSAAGFIQRIDETARRLNDAISRVDRVVLNETTLTNIAVTIANFRQVSERALNTMSGVDRVVESNVPPVTVAISNLVVFSEQLGRAAIEVDLLVRSNRHEISSAVKNIESSSEMLKGLLSGVQSGEGLLGVMFKHRSTETNFVDVLQNLAVVSSNLNVTSSNLNSRGLWRLLFSPKAPKTVPTAPPSAVRDR